MTVTEEIFMASKVKNKTNSKKIVNSKIDFKVETPMFNDSINVDKVDD